MCLAVLLSHAAHAENGVVVITMAGEAYRGAPKFRFVADDRMIGAGELAGALDTKRGARLDFQGGSKPPPSERFSFDVPDMDKVSQLDIEFVNDVSAGAGKHGNRNLYVLSLSVTTVKKTPRDTVVAIHEFRPLAFEAVKGGKILLGAAALYTNGTIRLKRPASGWAMALGMPNEPDAQAAEEAPKPDTSFQKCNIPPLTLAQFEKNSATLSNVMRDQLAGLKKSVGDKSCSLRRTTFTAGGPSQGFRANLSRARAQAVADELARIGFSKEVAKGPGRRVVVAVE